MQCNEIQEHLYDYLTGRLSATMNPVIAEHLMSCSACRAEHDEIKITLGLLDEIKQPKVSEGFTEKVMQGIEPKVLPFTKRPVYRFIMQGAAAAIVVLAVVSIIKLMPTSQPDTLTVRGTAETTTVSASCRQAIELYNKGTLNANLKQKETLLQQALAAGCTDNKVLARIHNNIADCYEQQGRLDEALSGYAKATQLDPQLIVAYMGLGDVSKSLGRFNKAIEYYEKALHRVSQSTETADQTQVNDIKKAIFDVKTRIK